MALADILYGGDRNMVVINMSEYKEDHKISRLTGSAPGYVGYGEGGVLTEAVRRKPYSVVLLDEVEKANVAVQEIFYQVFDKGMLQDDKGNEVNFKNTIIILTSNVGTDTIMKLCADPDTRPDPEALAEALRPDLLKAFKPALLGRISIVPYFPLDDAMLKSIIRLQLTRIGDRLREQPSGRVHVRRQPADDHRQPLQGGGKRRPQRRPHPDRHAVARAIRRNPDADDGGAGVPESPYYHVGGREIHVSDYVTASARLASRARFLHPGPPLMDCRCRSPRRKPENCFAAYNGEGSVRRRLRIQEPLQENRVDRAAKAHLAVDRDHGHAVAVLRGQVGRRVDVHRCQREAVALARGLKQCPGVVAQVAATARVEHEMQVGTLPLAAPAEKK